MYIFCNKKGPDVDPNEDPAPYLYSGRIRNWNYEKVIQIRNTSTHTPLKGKFAYLAD